MQGFVTLDFGNSHPHAGFFQRANNEWQLLKVMPLNELALGLDQFQMTPHNTSLVLSEVKAREEELQPFIERGFLLTRVKDYWRGTKFAGMPVNYAKTLGEDRLIEAFYAFKKEKKKTLLIDAGTFVTMDVVTTDGFLGGYIIPSLENYAKTFKAGDQLQGIELDFELSVELPTVTVAAMRDSYSAFGAMAKKLVKQHELEKIILTGGKAPQWSKLLGELKVPAVVEVESHLVHWALLYWMTTQIEPL